MQKRRQLRGLRKVAQSLGTQTIPVRVQEGYLEEVTSEERMWKSLAGGEKNKSVMRQTTCRCRGWDRPWRTLFGPHPEGSWELWWVSRRQACVCVCVCVRACAYVFDQGCLSRWVESGVISTRKEAGEEGKELRTV